MPYDANQIVAESTSNLPGFLMTNLKTLSSTVENKELGVDTPVYQVMPLTNKITELYEAYCADEEKTSPFYTGRENKSLKSPLWKGDFNSDGSLKQALLTPVIVAKSRKEEGKEDYVFVTLMLGNSFPQNTKIQQLVLQPENLGKVFRVKFNAADKKYDFIQKTEQSIFMKEEMMKAYERTLDLPWNDLLFEIEEKVKETYSFQTSREKKNLILSEARKMLLGYTGFLE